MCELWWAHQGDSMSASGVLGRTVASVDDEVSVHLVSAADAITSGDCEAAASMLRAAADALEGADAG